MAMQKRQFFTLTAGAALTAASLLSAPLGAFAGAPESFKIGLILPMTGQAASTGRQI